MRKLNPRLRRILIVLFGFLFSTLAAQASSFKVLAVSNQIFRLQLAGVAGDLFAVETSTNLSQWTAISTNQLTNNALFYFLDPLSPARPARFYRVSPR